MRAHDDEYLRLARWLEKVASFMLSSSFQLKLLTLPEMPVRNCRQPSGAVSGLSHACWVMRIFQLRENDT